MGFVSLTIREADGWKAQLLGNYTSCKVRWNIALPLQGARPSHKYLLKAEFVLCTYEFIVALILKWY